MIDLWQLQLFSPVWPRPRLITTKNSSPSQRTSRTRPRTTPRRSRTSTTSRISPRGAEGQSRCLVKYTEGSEMVTVVHKFNLNTYKCENNSLYKFHLTRHLDCPSAPLGEIR